MAKKKSKTKKAEHSQEDLNALIEGMLELGLLEVVGTSPRGEPLFRQTEKAKKMHDFEREAKKDAKTINRANPIH